MFLKIYFLNLMESMHDKMINWKSSHQKLYKKKKRLDKTFSQDELKDFNRNFSMSQESWEENFSCLYKSNTPKIMVSLFMFSTTVKCVQRSCLKIHRIHFTTMVLDLFYWCIKFHLRSKNLERTKIRNTMHIIWNIKYILINIYVCYM